MDPRTELHDFDDDALPLDEWTLDEFDAADEFVPLQAERTPDSFLFD